MISWREDFLSSDTSIAINSTEVDGTDFTSKQIPLAHAQYASLTLYVKGAHASCSKDIIFKFAAYDSKRKAWDTNAYLTYNLAANGTSAVQKTIALIPDVEKIKLLSVQNQETTAGYTVTINASIFVKEKHA